MTSADSPKRRSRGGLIATAAAVVLLVVGLALVGISMASQESAPQPDGASGPWGTTAADGERSNVRATPSPKTVLTLPASKPIALDIPSIDVHSVVQYLGQAADGSLEAPAVGPHYNEAAWYRYSPTPGSLGPSILLGHVDSAADGPSVFFRLGELRPGDRISVSRADGSVAVFSVDEVHRYAKDNFPTKTVYGDIDHAGLRVLTCGGAFDNSTGHYLDNIVVFASLVETPQTS
jgi:hypothetical protein